MGVVIPFPKKKSNGRRKRRRTIPPPPERSSFFPYKRSKDKSVVEKSVDVSQLAAKALQKYRTPPDGPFFFMKEWLGINPDPWPNDIPPSGWTRQDGYPLWTKQREILEALFRDQRVTVRSGNGVGKTYLASLAALTFLYAFHGIVITTGRSWRQVREQLWGEINRVHRSANENLLAVHKISLGGQPNQTDLRLSPKWYAIGFSTDDPDRFRGFHGERILLIVDEACGVDKEIFDAAETILTSDQSYILLIGNPTDPTGYFYKSFQPNSGYVSFTISCYDSPNVRHGRSIYPELTSKTWVEQRERKWGEDSPMFKACVLAEFPEEREDSLIPLRYIQAALDRELPEDGMVVSYGLDVARFGDDATILGRRQANGRFRIVWEHRGKATTSTVGRAVFTWREECVRQEGDKEIRWEAPVNVDDIGVGGGVTDQLLEEDVPTNGINVAEKAIDAVDDDEHPEKFENKRAQFYWRLRQAFMKGEVDIDDEELGEQLSRILYDFKRGRIKIEAKDEYKKRYGHSPDKADAMMLAWAEAEFEEGGRLVGGWM